MSLCNFVALLTPTTWAEEVGCQAPPGPPLIPLWGLSMLLAPPGRC